MSTYTGTATRPTAAATKNAIDTACRFVPSTRRITGRAIPIRSTKSPIAHMTARNAIALAVTSRGVAALSAIEGTTNSGCGPGFGPTANVKAPRTGCPSTEITRQKTRYQPDGIRLSGTTSWFAFVGERRGGPAVSWLPAASVTETMAKRGSTGSL